MFSVSELVGVSLRTFLGLSKEEGRGRGKVPCIALSSGGLLCTRLRVRECRSEGEDE